MATTTLSGQVARRAGWSVFVGVLTCCLAS